MKVYFDTIGCRLNQAEIERLANQFRKAGHTIMESAQEADMVVINTCAVTAAAASDSREKARQAHAAGAKQIVLTGCWATLEPENAAGLPGVMRVVTNQHKEELGSDILGIPLTEFEVEPIIREPLPGIHRRTRAFIKVQDGCDNFCTFCVTRIARGRGMSVPEDEVIREINAAVQGGAQEAVLSGVHLGSWGNDWKNGKSLRDLIQVILDHTKIRRLRLSSLEPWDLEKSFFELWNDPRMCRHLHFPLQSGSGTVLRRMARNTTPEKYRELVSQARSLVPGLAITTDIIAGFPQETDAEFEESLEFVKEMNFAGGHVFKYSAREGTAAARLPQRVHGKIAHERSRQMREAIQQSAKGYASGFKDQVLEVLWESSAQQSDGTWQLHGLTDNYLRAATILPENHWNRVERVRVVSVLDDHLLVRVI
jgi:threonylcarbamoyladenosine tRNA methylthiotransferase MtaB